MPKWSFLLILISFGFGNLLNNGDFEQALTTGWQQASYGSYVVIDRATGYDPDPDYEARCEKGDGTGYATLYQTVNVPNTHLIFSCAAKVYAYDNHSTAWCGAAVRIFYMNSAGTKLGETMICMRSTQNPWGNTSTRHLIIANDSLWHDYEFNVNAELTNLPGVDPAQVAQMQIALYDTCYDC